MTVNAIDLSIFDDFIANDGIDLSLIKDSAFELKIKIS